MRRLLSIFIAVAAALLLGACLPESIHPLSSPTASVIDPRSGALDLHRSEDRADGPIYWHFHFRADTRWLEISSVDHRKDGKLVSTHIEALAMELGGHKYFSFREVPESRAKKPRTYSFARYEVDWRGDLLVWLIDRKALATAIRSGELRGKVTPGKFGDHIELTDSSSRLAVFVAASDPKTLFGGQPLTLRRLAR